MRTVADLELTSLRANKPRQLLLQQGVELLKQGGIFNMLRVFARPFLMDRGANPHSATFSAGYAEGYNTCLEQLEFFDQLYLSVPSEKGQAPIADFGGLRLARARGDITDKDMEMLRGKKG